MSRDEGHDIQFWTDRELEIFQPLASPFAIQTFLDDIPYSADPIYRCPAASSATGRPTASTERCSRRRH